MTKLCIVAAAGPGMGAAIARRFAREGFDLALISRRAEALDPLVRDIESMGRSAVAYACDLSDDARIEATFETITQTEGDADVLVYNGAAWNDGAPLSMPATSFHNDLALCVTGAYACVRAVYPAMKKRGGGSILFTGGGLALQPAYGTRVLSLVAGKSALRGLGLALFEALKPDNIHAGQVTIAGVVAPGTAFDPDRIADEYWSLHTQAPDARQPEIIFSGNQGTKS